MGREFFGVIGFDLGPLLQGQTRIAKLKSAYNSLIISRRALAREGDYEMMSVCACVRACVRALVSHADFSKTTTATDFL